MSLISKFLTISGFTAISRILGVVREAVFSHFLGASVEMDAFLIAYRFPGFFRKFFAEGGFQSIFSPYYADFLSNSKRNGGRYFSSRVFTIILGFVFFVTCLVLIFAKQFVLLMAPGFANDTAKLSLAIEFTRVIFPSISFLSLSSVYSAILMMHKKFFYYSLPPILVNLVLISSLCMGQRLMTAGWRVSIGYFIAGVLQFLYLYLCLKHLRLTIPVFSSFKITSRTKEFFKKLIPVLAGAGVAQINIFVGSLFGSFLPTGGISCLYFADRFIQFPLALFGISIGVVLLPEIAINITRREYIKDTINKSILFAMRLTFPSIVILSSLSYLFISLLYGHGQFSDISVQKTANVLKLSSLGLPAYVTAKIISSVLFAEKDSKTPVAAGCVSIVANAVLSIILIKPFQELGIAFATAVSGFINVYIMLKQSKIQLFSNKEFIKGLFKIFIASVILLLCIEWLKETFCIDRYDIVYKILAIAMVITIGMVVYAWILYWLNDTSVKKGFKIVKCWILKR
ncbi:MAG: murein biosynthesis integral membrane protein MurJ [Holosporales bacterium]|jgi:putative peptidoglycan lipid II flippase|nr:murein biosynthesis integral membrane protein MurJ [Holosporales bacterium]